MSLQDIQDAVVSVEEHYKNKPDAGPRADKPATAVIENGLRCRVQSPDGTSVHTDMPVAVGGTATANSPGWLSRAAIASCDATLLAIRAARQGLELETIEVNVEASSDGRGMFLDEGIPPGSTEIHIRFNIVAQHVSRAQLQELVDWVIAHSPVGTDIAQAVKVSIELESR